MRVRFVIAQLLLTSAMLGATAPATTPPRATYVIPDFGTAYTMSLVPPHDRARAAGVTAAVRPAAASIAPVLTGLAFHFAALGLPFVLAGGIKIAYDVALLVTFRTAKPEDLPLAR